MDSRAKLAQPLLVIYDDGQGNFGPMTALRPIFDVRTGAWTTRQRIQHALETQPAAMMVAPHHKPVLIAREPGLRLGDWPAEADDVLLVNGRCANPAALQEVRALPPLSVLVQDDGQRVAARIGRQHRPRFMQGPHDAPADSLTVVRCGGRVLLERPWHVIDELPGTLCDDLNHFALPARESVGNGAIMGSHAVRIANDAFIHPLVVLDATAGPIVVDHAATVSSFAVLTGPCYIGAHSAVAPHTHIRPGTSIGPHCAVGGEVASSIMQAYSNKAHSGYLGNSFVGEWVNLGAQTTVSNLKNTYGSVRVQLALGGEAEDTGLTKLGPVIGDFVRTAIGSRLLTGSCIGTAAMVAVSSFAPKFVERFAFLTDAGSGPADVDKVLTTAEQMMKRRGIDLHQAQADRLRAIAASA